MASRLNPNNFGYQNFYSATLTGDITSGTLTIGLDTVPTPTSGILIINPDSSSREVILYTSKGASTITCPADGRGFSSTSATSHLQGTTVIMAPVDKWFSALASGELSTDPLRTELFYDYVASGCVWTGDSYGSTRAASMTSGVVYINGRRLTVAAVSARTFTASVDTYVDFYDNGDGTAAIEYNEVTNNNASPALTTNYLRNAIIVTAAGSIAAVGSINQGQEYKVLPIASSTAYTVTDSLGNLICPRDPSRKLLGYRQITAAGGTTSSASDVVVAGLSCPVKVPDGRKVIVSAYCYGITNGSATGAVTLSSGATLNALTTGLQDWNLTTSGQIVALDTSVVNTPTLSPVFYSVAQRTSGGTISFGPGNSATRPAYIKVELV